LDEALQYRPGNTVQGAAQILLRDAVVALLNALHPDVNFRLSEAEVTSIVNSALRSLDKRAILEARSEIQVPADGYCPLQ
jgi:hypothetical protein